MIVPFMIRRMAKALDVKTETRNVYIARNGFSRVDMDQSNILSRAETLDNTY